MFFDKEARFVITAAVFAIVLFIFFIRLFFVEEKEKEKEKEYFKLSDQVLVRDDNTQKWIRGKFTSYLKESKFPFVVSGFTWKQCILYEGNEHLVGTTGSPEEDDGE